MCTSMKFVKITKEFFEELKELQIAFKLAIEEKCPDETDSESLYKAIEGEKINFYGCLKDRFVEYLTRCFCWPSF